MRFISAMFHRSGLIIAAVSMIALVATPAFAAPERPAKAMKAKAKAKANAKANAKTPVSLTGSLTAQTFEKGKRKGQVRSMTLATDDGREFELIVNKKNRGIEQLVGQRVTITGQSFERKGKKGAKSRSFIKVLEAAVADANAEDDDPAVDDAYDGGDRDSEPFMEEVNDDRGVDDDEGVDSDD